MRLLRFDQRGELSLSNNLLKNIPPYAILSHTWGDENEEVTFLDLKNGCGRTKTGYTKIKFCGDRAQEDGLQYFWVDTCCVDKANSTELSEAITSMFRWYRDSMRCYVYLSDVSAYMKNNWQIDQSWRLAFESSRWFTRGWTLQELIAPKVVEFFSRDGERLGCKTSLALQIHAITQIPIPALQGYTLSTFGVDERLQWAENRETKREEDKAYCLLGLFVVSMSLRYGEGENAYSRLRKKIDKSSRTNHQDSAEPLDLDSNRSAFDPTTSENSFATVGHVNEDGWNIDFGDTRDFLIESFTSIVNLHPLTHTDLEQSNQCTTHWSFSEFVHKEIARASSASLTSRRGKLLSIFQLGKWMYFLDLLLQDSVVDEQAEAEMDFRDVKSINTSYLWRLTYLNVKFSLQSEIKFQKGYRWMSELRRNLELLVNAVRNSRDQKAIDENALRIELREIFLPIIGLLHSSLRYLQKPYQDEASRRAWNAEMEHKIKESFESLTKTIRYLREICNNRFCNSRLFDHVSHNQHAEDIAEPRHPAETEPTDCSEKVIFPISMLPHLQTDRFTGREKELDNVHAWLGQDRATNELPALRNYTIYGRRGIGKTQIVLEYARRYCGFYEAIFWIQSETKGSLRQSFTDIAVALKLKKAGHNANFDENRIRVLQWLRRTEKRWLLIYDNAEREHLLRGHWPTGGRGSILLTSRSYYNFFEDERRHGATIPVFNDEERREFLLSLLGETWMATHLNTSNMMYGVEKAAIAALLKMTGGLPIAIRHAANMTLDPEIEGCPTKGSTVYGFMDLFRRSYEALPKRLIAQRDPLTHALDTIWKVAFDNLGEPAKHILSGLSLLAPDSILIDLFVPSDQRRLAANLEFCKISHENSQTVLAEGTTSTFSKNLSPELTEAIDELLGKNLIKKTGREISIHRTVQEAVSYQGADELTEYYDSMIQLLFDAFPEQCEGRPLRDYWENCTLWSQHVVSLAYKYRQYTSNRPLNASPLKGLRSGEIFAKLLANTAWYLFEVADYDEALNIIDIAKKVLLDKTSIVYAHLLNTEGVTYYEQNRLQEAREALEACLAIRELHLSPTDVEMANVLSNLGNIETAEGNLDTALEYLKNSLLIREGLGSGAEILLALNYMQLGRAHFLGGHYTLAYYHYQKCEDTLNVPVCSHERGRSKRFFMAHLQYAYGNLDFVQGKFNSARKAFDQARQMSQEMTTVAPLTVAAYYKLGCVEFKHDHYKEALKYLSMALDIAEVRSPGVMDGTIARILWKKAEVMLEDPLADDGSATQLMADIEISQKAIADELGVDATVVGADGDREKSFDLLVPGYFR